MVSHIDIGAGLIILIDDQDAHAVTQYNWVVRHSSKTKYAKTFSPKIGQNMRLLHRFIMKAPVGVVVDHINGNGLDCRRENLRLVTQRQNSQNSYVQERTKTSRFKGVSRVASSGLWQAQISDLGVTHNLGSYSSEEDAARSYDDAALRLFGEFARTNRMMGLFEGQSPIERNAIEFSGDLVLTPVQDPRSWERAPGEYAPVLTATKSAHWKQKRAQAQAERISELAACIGLADPSPGPPWAK